MASSSEPHYRPYRAPADRWEPTAHAGETYAGGHANGHANGGIATPDAHNATRASSNSSLSATAGFPANGVPACILPQGRQSLSGISLRAHLLGVASGVCICATGALIYWGSELWRLFFFIGILATFHFLEFYVTAAYNTSAANLSAFLLTSNGSAYAVAHTVAGIETVLGHTVLRVPTLVPAELQGAKVAIGLGLVLVGQTARSMAMAKAGTNFNHTVQTHKKWGHELVTDGVYGVLRHPSYFGFFWWGLGSQIVMGNVVCLVGYAIVLWRFFRHRIRKEEELLVRFFGDDYIEYRKRTYVGIPFIS